jgi:hypothetical protein
MKITVKGNSNEKLEIRADEGLDKAEQILQAIRKMSRKLRHLSKDGFEIDLMIKSLNNHQEEYLHQSLFTHPFYRDYTTTEREQPQKGAKMNKKQTYVERMLESSRKVTAAAEKALTFAEETGLTLEETEEIPGTIESILKKERYQGNRKYKRPRSMEATGPED